jgi:hypothetical protein
MLADCGVRRVPDFNGNENMRTSKARTGAKDRTERTMSNDKKAAETCPILQQNKPERNA